MKSRTLVLFAFALTAVFMLSGCETVHSRLLLKKASVEVLPSPMFMGPIRKWLPIQAKCVLVEVFDMEAQTA